jgi:hypothetical protein
MIHLTVAAPLGIDSIFFSFIQRLALQNGHVCVEPPAQQLDDPEPGGWIEAMSRSGQHHFVIGYRYPPHYWKKLVEHSATVALLADGDGIVRQVEHIHRQKAEDGEKKDVKQSVQVILHAVDAMLEMTEWVLNGAEPTRLLPPAGAFQDHSGEAFQRLESFYQQAGVPFTSSCWQGFSTEAQPLLERIHSASPAVVREIQRLFSLEESTPSRLEAVGALFPGYY